MLITIFFSTLYISRSYFLTITYLFSFLLQELLTKHKILCAEFLENNYDKVFEHYQKLLNSENYVTRRQALKVRAPAGSIYSAEIKLEGGGVYMN